MCFNLIINVLYQLPRLILHELPNRVHEIFVMIIHKFEINFFNPIILDLNFFQDEEFYQRQVAKILCISVWYSRVETYRNVCQGEIQCDIDL